MTFSMEATLTYQGRIWQAIEHNHFCEATMRIFTLECALLERHKPSVVQGKPRRILAVTGFPPDASDWRKRANEDITLIMLLQADLRNTVIHIHIRLLEVGFHEKLTEAYLQRAN
jgi:hypothetical protein